MRLVGIMMGDALRLQSGHAGEESALELSRVLHLERGASTTHHLSLEPSLRVAENLWRRGQVLLVLLLRCARLRR